MKSDTGAECPTKPPLGVSHPCGTLVVFGVIAFSVYHAQAVYFRSTGYSKPFPGERGLHVEQAQIELPGCRAASRVYVAQMAARGFEAKHVSLPGSATYEPGLRMTYVPGFRATSRLLSARDDIAAESNKIRHKYNIRGSLAQCPYYIEAARVLGIERESEKKGRPTRDGFGGALARCAGTNFVESFPEVDPHLEKHQPLKECTAEKCISVTRPACQKFLAAGGDAPLPVYSYVFDKDTNEKKQVKKRYTFLGSSATKVVSDPEDACMFVIEIIEVRAFQALSGPVDKERGRFFNYAGLKHWDIVDGIPGRNHIVVLPSCSSHCDRSPTRKEHGDLGQARILSPIFWHMLYRQGFDISLPQPPKDFYEDLAAGAKPRVYRGKQPLCFFRGGANGIQKWDLDRIIPAAFANNPAKGVFLEVRHRNSAFDPLGNEECDNYSTDPRYNDTYLEMMTTATFGYAPGGGGPYSWRLMEAFSGGAIPVVTEDMIVPFQGLTWKPVGRLWKNCAVVLSSDDMYVVGDVLRAVLDEGEIAFEHRKESCRELWNEFLLYGNGTVPERHYEARRRLPFEQIRHDLKTISHSMGLS